MEGVNLSRLKEMVDSRHGIQSLCFDLVSFMNNNYTEIEQHKKTRSHTAQLAGAAFSLWRAVFLTESTDSGELLITARSFLEKVVRTNMIGFNDDISMQAWTSGYYLNNAKYRLLLVSKENSSCRNRMRQEDSKSYSGKNIEYLLTNEISGKDRQLVWDDCFAGAKIAFDCVKVDFGVWARKLKNKKEEKAPSKNIAPL